MYSVLVGNKCDMLEQRQVTTENGQQLAKSWGNCTFIETSAKLKIKNVEVFHQVIRDIRNRDATFQNKNSDASAKKWKLCNIL